MEIKTEGDTLNLDDNVIKEIYIEKGKITSDDDVVYYIADKSIFMVGNKPIGYIKDTAALCSDYDNYQAFATQNDLIRRFFVENHPNIHCVNKCILEMVEELSRSLEKSPAILEDGL